MARSVTTIKCSLTEDTSFVVSEVVSRCMESQMGSQGSSTKQLSLRAHTGLLTHALNDVTRATERKNNGAGLGSDRGMRASTVGKYGYCTYWRKA